MHIDDRVIFIHNPRAAGTATRRALLQGADPNANIPYPGNMAFGRNSNQKHMFAPQVHGYLARDDWDGRFKFVIVRNPWDRMVSLYGLFRRPIEPAFVDRSAGAKMPVKLDKLIHAVRHPDIGVRTPKEGKRRFNRWAFGLGFKEWMMGFCEDYRWNACRYLNDERPMTRIPQARWTHGVDRVFRFEDLDPLDGVLAEHGYDRLGRENATERKPWRSYYDRESFDFVAQACREDIEMFGYQQQETH